MFSFGPEARDPTPCEALAQKIGVPYRFVQISNPEIAKLYECPLVLVRSDGHVAWRGTTDDCPKSTLATVAGSILDSRFCSAPEQSNDFQGRDFTAFADHGACCRSGLQLADKPRARAELPTRPINLVVAYAAGGSTDITARFFSPPFSDAIGRPVLVTNRPGAGGISGTAAVANTRGQGHTLLWAPTTLALLPALYPKLPFDLSTSFTPIGRVTTGPLVLAVNSKLPVRTAAELIAYAKERPGKVNYGSPGYGTIIHLAIELFASMSGIRLNHIPYSGNGPSQQALINGEIDVTLASLAAILGLREEANVRALGITTLGRNPLMPSLATINESGLPGYEVMEWAGLVAPATCAADNLRVLRAAYEKATQSPAFEKSIEHHELRPSMKARRRSES